MNTNTYILSLAALILSTLSFAATDGGTTAVNFLHLDVGARYLGMGGVGTANAMDIMGVNYNPAAIGKLDTFHIGGSTGKQGMDFKTNFVGLSVPLPFFSITGENPLILGVSGMFSDNGDEFFYSSTYSRERSFGKDTALALTLSEQFAESNFDIITSATMYHYLGASAKYIKSTLPDDPMLSAGDVNAEGVAFDVGYQGYAPEYGFGLGVSLLNMGPDITYIDAKEKLPLTLRAGIAFDLIHLDKFSLNLAGDYIRYINEKDNRAHVGAEAWIIDILAARAGYRFLEDDKNNITLGFGIRLLGFEVDYGFMLDPLFGGDVNQISITYTFQKKKESASSTKTYKEEAPKTQPVKQGPRNPNPIIY